MNDNNSRMLPSISNLLISSPSTNNNYANEKQQGPPKLNLYPASPTIPRKSPNINEYYLSLENRRYSSSSAASTISPVLSPMASPISNYTPVTTLNNNNASLPPLEGDDPPQRLRLLSPSLSPITPKSLFNTTSWNNSYSAPSSSSESSCSSTEADQEDDNMSCTNSITIGSPSSINHRLSSSPQPLPIRTTPPPPPPPVPNTQIVFDSSGQPILKRRRGRPPTCLDQEVGSFTFLTPTVWDIHISEEQKQKEIKADLKSAAASASSSSSSSFSRQRERGEEHMLNAFTNSNMDTLLQMPRKKRGRKPKTHISGNSCFVWKDLTSTRSSSSAGAAGIKK